MKLFRFLPFLGLLLLPMPAAAQLSNNLLSTSPCAYVDCVVNSLNVAGSTVPANGIYLTTTNTIAFATNGSARFDIGTSLNGHTSNSIQIVNTSMSTTVPGYTGKVDSTSGLSIPASGQWVLDASGVDVADYAATTASTISLKAATTITNATVKMTALAQSTAADVLCFAISTGLVTYEPTGTTCTVSARRFKTDIHYLSDATMLTEVLGMKPVSFRFKPGVDDGGAEVHYGLIAEDVAKVAPELVAYEKDGQTHGVKYGDGELQSHLIGAIKAEQDEIKVQEKEIKLLRREVAKLERH